MNLWNALRRALLTMKASYLGSEWTFVYHVPAGSVDIYGRPIGGSPGQYYRRYDAETGRFEYRHATSGEAIDEERSDAW